jgi:hypothetical protein
MRRLIGVLLLAVGTIAGPAASGPAVETLVQSTLPERLTDAEYWRLVETFSEPDGYFDSDNLVSNEDQYQTVIPSLKARARGGAYLGVGPDQNFTYIVALRPPVAFITDIRRGNLHVHLMYKAAIELSATRAEFLSRLFGRRPPSGLALSESAASLLSAFESAPADAVFTRRTSDGLISHLETTRRFRLAPGDAAGIKAVHAKFVRGGAGLRFVSSRPGNRYPSYTDLQTATDARGEAHGYLTSEQHYQTLRSWQQRNLIVPIVGNFAGPKAIKAVATYLREHQATVGVFYTSNVERYLFQDGIWDEFMGNVRALPSDERSTIVRSCFDTCSSFGESRAVTLLDSMAGLVAGVRDGRVGGYRDVLMRSRRE